MLILVVSRFLLLVCMIKYVLSQIAMSANILHLSLYLSSTVYIFRFKMASTWRYTLVCLDSVMDISTTD